MVDTPATNTFASGVTISLIAQFFGNTPVQYATIAGEYVSMRQRCFLQRAFSRRIEVGKEGIEYVGCGITFEDCR